MVGKISSAAMSDLLYSHDRLVESLERLLGEKRTI